MCSYVVGVCVKWLKIVMLNGIRIRGREVLIIHQGGWTGIQVRTTEGNTSKNHSKRKIIMNEWSNFSGL